MSSEVSREEVLQAEEVIKQLAEELARAKGIADSVEEVRRRLDEATNLLEQSRRTMDEAKVPLQEATMVLNRASEQLNQSTQDLSERIQQTLQQTHQNMQERITTGLGQAQKALLDVANSLAELRTGFENQMSALVQQNDQMLQLIAAQDAETKRLSKLLTFCLIFSITTIATGLFILVWLLIHA